MIVNTDLLLSYGASVKEVAKGEVIYQEGEAALFYFQLVKGRVKWMHVDEEGREFIHDIVEAGEPFGEGPLFDGDLYDATAVAEASSTLIRLKLPLFQQLLDDHPDIHFAFTRLLSRQLHFKLLLVKMLANCNPEYRLTTLLGYLVQHKKNVCFTCNKLLLTRKQLAGMVGLRIETVIRTMKQLEQKELLSINKGKVYISNMT
ncbi:Crp/Fnr family transcriptional regulator [Agriterribacter sp.]|uniref:Crp/Fnr family transcriptional regulator n=1 Tax=Agriterribacter sp. TaxID=2821509 RepID=UPI002BF33F9C|nr:Crp/Fnr family transcriptional regulator [Agriterribacter sp.]HRO48211.1 Crp/Fnr family transcriptional regulator [Agriterribacter sp.]HRQ18730.1 Crp/Fnr family transcriptional regulator [Agriterribacter sp.]